MRKLLIKDMDVFIELDGIITGIIGPTNSGKTVVLKKLCNKIDNTDILIDDVPIDEYDISFLRNNIVVCLDDGDFKEEYVAEEVRGENGFGFDEIFELENGKTLAELTEEEKNEISARKIALENIRKKLIDL